MASRRERLPRILRAGDKQKRTFVISADTDMRISAAAKRRGIDRSELVEALLSSALAHVRISFDGKSDAQGSAVA